MQRLVSLMVLVMMVMMAGCTQVRPVFQQTDTVTIFEVDRDTMLYVMPDSAMIQAWFKCDSLNRVIMTDLVTLQGRKISPVVRWRDNTLTVVAGVDSEQVYFAWKERHIKETRATTQTIIEKVKEPPWWKRRDVLITALIMIAYTIFLIIKIKK